MDKLHNNITTFNEQEIKTVKEYKEIVAETLNLHWKLQNIYNDQMKHQMTKIVDLLILSSLTFEHDKKLMRNGSIRIFSKSIHTFIKKN